MVESKNNTINLISLETIRTSNYTGLIREYTIIYNTLLGEQPVHCLDLYTLNNQLGYQLAFCTNEKNWGIVHPVFQEMIESFAFIP